MTNTPNDDAVGAYKDPKGGGSSILPWLLGLLALLVLLALLLWALGVFSDDDDDLDDRDDGTTINRVDDDSSLDVEDTPGEIDTDEGFTPPSETLGNE